MAKPNSMMFSAVSVFLAVFNAQIITLDFKRELFYPTYKRTRRVARYTFGICFIGTALIAIFGYLGQGDNATPSLIFLRSPIDKHNIREYLLKGLLSVFLIASMTGISTFIVPMRRIILDILQ